MNVPGTTRWGIWWSAARPRTLPAAVAPVVVGTALAGRMGGLDPAAAGICLGFAVLIQIGTNFANDYYDFIKGADTAARVGPTRAVAAGWVTPAAMKRAMLAVFAAAFLLGLSLIAWGGPWLLVIGVASVVCGIAYTGGPWPLAYHGWGDVFVFVFFGLVAVAATFFVQTGTLVPAVWLLAVPVGLLAANILVVNNYRDADTDAAAGKRTLVVRFGRGFARAQFGVSLLLAFALLPFAVLSLGGDWWVLLPWALAPWGWGLWRRLNPAAPPGELIALLGATGRFLALYALLIAAGLWLAAHR
ncbi:MAG: 1,4-dihydroxy-2-naphthoate polyprenyltransferase [Opitutaceae bacterium]|nr:1,4-dihydroxy-2-naphthoate polyprenyltransferase [Opitutaceae bacterium]